MYLMRVTGAWIGVLADWLSGQADDIQQSESAVQLKNELEHWRHQAVVPMHIWQNMLDQAVHLHVEGSGQVALLIGACVQPRHIGVLGYLVLACSNLADAMLAYQRYERLFYGHNLAEIQMTADEVEIRWAPLESSDESSGRWHDSCAIAALITFLRRQMREPPPPALVAFCFAAPVTEEEQIAYEVFFQCPVRFADHYTRVRFPRSYLTLSMPQCDPGLKDLLDRQAQALLHALPDSEPWERALQHVMLRLMPEGRTQLPEVAHSLHVSVRSLQRRLEQRGMTWQQLLDRTRSHLAQQYLQDASLSLAEIAHLLGYSEQSAMTRAFVRWTGSTPAQARKSFRQTVYRRG